MPNSSIPEKGLHSGPGVGPRGGTSPKAGDVIADKYRIEKFIGRGGMAEVFAGLNVRTGKRVALKWVNPALATTEEARSRFRREALAAGRINHPNVVTVFDVVEHGWSTWLVMELLEGEALSHVLHRVGFLEPEAAVQLLIPAMRGVAAAHARGVIHRDLTPDNIFICASPDGRPPEAKVLDFGIAKLVGESADKIGITGLGHAVGTPAYMAPEQVRGSVAADARTDVYALGVVLYQMLAGRRPYDGQIYSAMMIEIATVDPPPLSSLQPHVPAALATVVHRAMARNRDVRFPDVNAFIAALDDLIRVDVSYGQNKISGAQSGRPTSALFALPDLGDEPSERSRSAVTNRELPFATPDDIARARVTPAPRDPMSLTRLMTPPSGTIRPALATPPPSGIHAWPRRRLVAAATAVGVGGIALVVAVARGDREALPSRLAVDPPRPAATLNVEPPATNQLVVLGVPSFAKIEIDGVVVDGNPFRGRYRHDQIHRVVVSAPGYEPRTEEVSLTQDQVVTLALEKWSPPAKPPAPRRTVENRPLRRSPPSSTPARAAAALAPTVAPAEPRDTRDTIVRAVAAPAAMAVDPAGGRAPVRPIQTASPYDLR